MSSTLTDSTPPTVARVILAPDRATPISGKSIFLAGSIDMGTARDWQAASIQHFAQAPVTLLSPRRAVWESGWTQDIDFAPFREQVEWELDMLERADVIMLFITAESKAPISLMELGLFAKSGRLVVGCEEGFYRRGNVQIVCKRYGVELFDSLEGVLAAADKKLNQ